MTYVHKIENFCRRTMNVYVMMMTMVVVVVVVVVVRIVTFQVTKPIPIASYGSRSPRGTPAPVVHEHVCDSCSLADHQ